VAAIHGFQQRAAAAAATLHQARIDQVALSKQMLEARLQVMRAQIEPHFLFNTLANVKRLCQSDVDGGITMLDNLVLYLRAALPRMRDEQSTLAQEAELVQSYLAVLKIRMGARLRYSIDVPPALGDQPFPPMMLLTLAENAIKHGLNPSSTGGGIAIRALATRSGLEVRVADSGVGFGAAATGGTGVGLSNTRARLAAIHGDAAELEFMANEPTGVIAVIRVPLAATQPRPSIAGAVA
jgi:LytS/YehU family sensor histidine kinase